MTFYGCTSFKNMHLEQQFLVFVSQQSNMILVQRMIIERNRGDKLSFHLNQYQYAFSTSLLGIRSNCALLARRPPARHHCFAPPSNQFRHSPNFACSCCKLRMIECPEVENLRFFFDNPVRVSDRWSHSSDWGPERSPQRTTDARWGMTLIVGGACHS